MAKDKCVMCGKETKYDETTHIDFRSNYIEGAGQLCNDCASGETKKSDFTSTDYALKSEFHHLDYVTVSNKDILSRSNNFDLGLFVRTLFNNKNKK